MKLSSTYPPAPTVYINNYTNDNLRNGIAPPPPPTILVWTTGPSGPVDSLLRRSPFKDNYSCFGKLIDPNDVLIRTLESQGIARIYKTNDHKKELKKLNRSILINYLALLDILVKSPNTLGKYTYLQVLK